jgi:hypothetical protein
MTRQEILEAAHYIISHDRNSAYGDPEDNFETIQKLWNAYLDRRQSVNVPESNFRITGFDTAIMMALVKIARIAHNPETQDNYVDLAGYAACAGETALSSQGTLEKVQAYSEKANPR